MSANMMKIAVPASHPEYKTLDQVKMTYSEAEIVELVNRQIESQIRAKEIRLRAKAKEQARKQVLSSLMSEQELEELVKAKMAEQANGNH